MAGPTIVVDYVSDTGVTCRRRMPAWAATLLGEGAGASTVTCPKGQRPRVRYARITASGREHKFIVPNVGAANWIAAMGTAVIVPLFGAAVPGSANATLEGRTGEKTKDV
jgi:hypothetical protein